MWYIKKWRMKKLLFVIIFLASLTVKAQFQADFTYGVAYDTTKHCCQLQLSDNSDVTLWCEIYGWDWDFGALDSTCIDSAGSYTVCLTIHGICGDTSRICKTFKIAIDSNGCHIDSLTSIENNNSPNLQVNLFPNPFHISTTLKISRNDFTDSELYIYDILGQMKRRTTINSQEIIIERNDLIDGIYFYQLRNKTGQVATGKFIIQ